MSNPWPKVTKFATYSFDATHNLYGVTSHADGLATHNHTWVVTLIFADWECQPKIGFTHDEPDITKTWGGKLKQLEGKHLNDLMPVPPTAENVACWLLFDWIPHIDANRTNYEVSGIRVSKCNTFQVEVMRSQSQRWRTHIKELQKDQLLPACV